MYFIFIAACLSCFDQILAQISVQKHCVDLKVQEHININQILGMWFVVEVISHKQDVIPIREEYDTCAVVTISDKTYSVLSPMYTNYDYNQSYGRTYPIYDTHETRTEHSSYPYYTTPRSYRDPKYREQISKKLLERKPLRVTWDERGETITYAAYYTHPVGLWYSYPPYIALVPDSYTTQGVSDHLVGLIQVLKAVGSHMVLTFCEKWPEEKLFTAVLSRSPQLNKGEITGIHSLIRRKSLEFVKVQKMCSLNSSVQLSVNHILLLITTYVLATKS